jgi:hypothetical protein
MKGMSYVTYPMRKRVKDNVEGIQGSRLGSNNPYC